MEKSLSKTDLTDVTFIIPVRIDGIERLENLQAVTNFLIENFTTNILVVEASRRQNHFIEKLLHPEVKTFFIEDLQTVFHRTKYINFLAMKVQTTYIAVWDSDVIVAVEQIQLAINLLRRKLDDFVFPYDGRFLDTGVQIRENFLKYSNFNDLEANLDLLTPLYGFSATGGGFFANTLSYRTAGFENEAFFGWGIEDGERYRRWDNLDYSCSRVRGPMYHLNHPRGVNSGFENVDAKVTRLKEYLRICKMSKEELQQEVKTWPANRDLDLSGNESVSIKIIDMFGQVLEYSKMNNSPHESRDMTRFH